jgi:transient receptor potential cation channel subfamily M protein 3
VYLELFLDEEQVEKLHDFEEDCMDDMARNKEYLTNISTEERIMRTTERYVGYTMVEWQNYE